MLPPLLTLKGPSGSDSPLSSALSTLFEPSPILSTHLEPHLNNILATRDLTSYSELIDLSISHIQAWPYDLQAQFIAGHPRIGETKNLSTLSAKEQGATTSSTAAATPTPPEVLDRLAHLNACYEKRYPSLRYIIFVNGRSRAAVAEVMEDQLGLAHSLSPDEPPLDTIEPVEVGGEEWSSELKRAVEDVGHIAQSRLKALEHT